MARKIEDDIVGINITNEILRYTAFEEKNEQKIVTLEF